MQIIAQLGTLLGLSFISGINLYATVAVVGLSIKFQLVQGLPPGLMPLANDAVIFVALFLYAVEFLADKVPGLDTAWDSVHTFIRPFGGAIIALMQIGEASPALEVIVFMLGASLASAAHFTKAGARLVVNASPEPFSNTIISVGEDLGAVGLAYLSLAYPRAAFFLTLALLIAILCFLPLLYRTVRMLVSALFSRLAGLVRKPAGAGEGAFLPVQFDTFFDGHRAEDEEVLGTAKAYAARVPGVPKFALSYMVRTDKRSYLLYRRRFKIQAKTLAADEIEKEKLYPGVLLSSLLVQAAEEKWLVYMYKNLAEGFTRKLTPEYSVIEKPA